MANFLYPALRSCIYCGVTASPGEIRRFGDEHVIPLALGGNLILREASCQSCERIINKEIESPVLLNEWIYLRIKRNFPTRGKSKNRPSHVTLAARDGTSIKIPIQDFSTPVPLYKFIQPRILSGAPRDDDNKHWTMSVLTDKVAESAMRSKYPNWNGTHSIVPQPFRFARLLAKIGYCRAVSEFGYQAFTPFGLDVILGRSDDYFYTVGGSLDLEPAIPGGDHLLNIRLLFRSPVAALLMVDIRLFSQIVSPTYTVVVGEINLQDPGHAAALEKHRIAGKLLVVSQPAEPVVSE